MRTEPKRPKHLVKGTQSLFFVEGGNIPLSMSLQMGKS